jgi:4-hydroxy-3-methylbut-2-en-1-yl diphosphate reductase
MMRIILANPRGYCAGVERAILIVHRAIEAFGKPVYVRHEIVHNRHVVDSLRRSGAVFVDELDEIPAGALVIFSAHGVSPAVVSEAQARGLRMLDATCPLVTKVHLEVTQHARAGRSVIFIGHDGHPEIEGTRGHFDRTRGGEILLVANESDAETVTVPNPNRVAYATQTTLSVSDTARIVVILKRRFPRMVAPKKDDICYATQNRQTAARLLAERCDVLLVVGAPHSSNSTRLRELGSQCGVPAYLIQDASELKHEWLLGVDTVGLTSGASVPEVLVQGVIARVQTWWPGTVVESFGEPEHTVFRLPHELRPGVVAKAAKPA